MYTFIHHLGSRKTLFEVSGPSGAPLPNTSSPVRLDPHPSEIDRLNQEREKYMRAEIVKNWRELEKFQSEPYTRFEARATLLAELKDIQRNPIEKLKLLDYNDITMEAISKVIQLLQTEANPSVINDDKHIITSTIGGRLIFTQKQNVRPFLQRLLNNTRLINNFFSESMNRGSLEKRGDEEKISRLSRFVVAFESVHPEEDKDIIRRTIEALDAGSILKATDQFKKILYKYKGIEIEAIIGTQKGLIYALRNIGATSQAGALAIPEIRSDLETESKEKDFSKNRKLLLEELQKDFTPDQQLGQSLYKKVYDALPDKHPEKIALEKNRDESIRDFALQAEYMNRVDAFIKQHGSEDLGDFLQIYDDMKGLYGTFNFTDENKKMTKEMAIMASSFVLTAGIGPVLGGLGIGARMIQTGRVARAAELAKEGKNIRAGLQTVAGATAGATARTAEILGGIDTLARGRTVTRLSMEGLKFTTIDSLIRNFTREAGEKDGFDNFLSKLAHNTLMFGAFSGMEKIVGASLSRFLPRVAQAQGFTFESGGKLLAFTAGDVAVMQAMHLAESGKLEWDWMSAYQALAFRLGMRSVEAGSKKLSRFQEANVQSAQKLEELFPNLTRKWRESGGQTSISSEVSGKESSMESGGKRKLTVGNESKGIDKGALERVKDISTQIGKIGSDTVVAIPCYAKEDIAGVISAIRGQAPNGEKVVIYINAPKKGPYAMTSTDFQTKVRDTKRITADDPRIVIVSHHYDVKPTIGTVRADMMDAITASMNPAVKDPIVIGLDADTYKLSPNYFSRVREYFNKNPNISWGSTHLRWSLPNVDNATWLSERLMQSGMKPNRWVGASGGSTSFRLNRYNEIGGYERDMTLGEDTNLGVRMNEINTYEGSRIPQKVWVDPRRGQQSLEQGRRFQDQWNSNFTPVNKSGFKPENIQEMNEITGKFRDGGDLSPAEVAKLENFINQHVGGTDFSANKFSKFWNTQAKSSAYKVSYENGKIKILQKSPQNMNQSSKRVDNLNEVTDTSTTSQSVTRARRSIISEGMNPDEIISLSSTPSGRRRLQNMLKRLQSSDRSRWWKVATAIGVLTGLAFLASDSEKSKIGDKTGGRDPMIDTTSYGDKSKPGNGDGEKRIQYEEKIRDTENILRKLGDIDIEFKNTLSSIVDPGRISKDGYPRFKIHLTYARRNDISSRWKKGEVSDTHDQKWNEVTEKLAELKTLLTQKGITQDLQFINKLNAVIRDSSWENVQELQRWMGMEPKDEAEFQDGILGWRTNAKILEFIKKLQDAVEGK